MGFLCDLDQLGSGVTYTSHVYLQIGGSFGQNGRWCECNATKGKRSQRRQGALQSQLASNRSFNGFFEIGTFCSSTRAAIVRAVGRLRE
jgi:hypothetical protein